MVNDMSRVVIMTTDDEITPSCPMFLAIIKLLLVVAEPSIMSAATSFSSLNPSDIANGKISNSSPVGKALCGHKKGEKVEALGVKCLAVKLDAAEIIIPIIVSKKRLPTKR